MPNTFMKDDSDISDNGDEFSSATLATQRALLNNATAVREANRKALASVAELNRSIRTLGFVSSLIPVTAVAGALSAMVFRKGDSGTASTATTARQGSSDGSTQGGVDSHDDGNVCTVPDSVFAIPVCRVEFPRDATQDEILGIVKAALTNEDKSDDASGAIVEVHQTPA